MKVNVPKPQPDPALTALEQKSNENDLTSIQKDVSQQTDVLSRLFGSSAATAGSGLKAPILGL